VVQLALAPPPSQVTRVWAWPAAGITAASTATAQASATFRRQLKRTLPARRAIRQRELSVEGAMAGAPEGFLNI